MWSHSSAQCCNDTSLGSHDRSNPHNQWALDSASPGPCFTSVRPYL